MNKGEVEIMIRKRTISLSQMSKAKLACALPWRGNEGCNPTFILCILGGLLFIAAVSPLYKFLGLFIAACSFLKKRYVRLSIFLAGVFMTTPRYNTGTTRLLYESDGKLFAPSVLDYTLDCLIPEEELIHAGTTAFCCGSWLFKDTDNWIYRTAYNDRNKLSNFTKPYSDLSNNVMSGVWGQLHGTRTAYLQMPKASKSGRLVVFCHGYAGNWKLYQGILAHLDDCIVLSIGTPNTNGIFHKEDIEKIFTVYMPYLKSKGCDIREIHIVGLSNGVSAINTAIAHYSTEFDSYTTISANLSGVTRTRGSINFIGGSNDPSANQLRKQHQQCQRLGIRSTLYYSASDHFLLINEEEEAIKTLNRIIQNNG